MKIIIAVVYFLHCYAMIAICLIDTPLHKELITNKISFKVIIPFILLILVFIFYYLTCSNPGFVEQDSTPLVESRSNFFCQKCQIFIPLRSKHCNLCGRCVLRRDHHCPYTQICIGMKNHLFFIFYLFFEILICRFFIKQTFDLAFKKDDFKSWIFSGFQGGLISAGSVLAIIQPVFLFPIHVFMVFINRTTWELGRKESISYLKNWVNSWSPFSKGCCENIREFICMRWENPNYQIPSEEEWNEMNFFFTNEYYTCC